MSERLNHLPALDGLRALAVTFVVLYHLDIGWARGGFLGVDLFFVISGFLITTLLVRERDATGRIGLGAFWTRRFKRLVPPLVLMVAVTVLATRLWGVPEQWSSIRWDAAAALSYVANWRFVFADQSYFDTLLGPSPLRHTWSLAVEEQWYLVWPLAMAGLMAVVVRFRRGTIVALTIVATAAVASAALMAVLYVASDPSRVYYGTDTRAQQLLVGAGLALAIRQWPALVGFGRDSTGATAGLVALVAFALFAAFTPDDAPWLYHGGFLAISLVGVVAVLATATATVATPLRWLTARPMQWIGVRSYGIYLWHWPVIIFVGAPIGLELGSPWLELLQVVLSLLLADLSLRLVERPTRRSSWRPQFVVASWSIGAAALALGAFAVLDAPSANRFAGVTFFTPSLLDDQTSSEPRVPTGSPSVATDSPSVPTDGPSATTPALQDSTTVAPTTTVARAPVVAILGDSTATRMLANRQPEDAGGWDVYGYAQLGCGAFDGDTLDAGSASALAPPPGCDQWRTSWSAAVEQAQPDVSIVMTGAWEVLDRRVDGVDIRFPTPEWHDEVRHELGDAVTIAGETGARVAVMSLPCMTDSDDAETAARADPARVEAFNVILSDIVAADTKASMIDLGSLLCPDGTPLQTVAGNVARYDGVHLSEPGVSYVWNWLLPQIDRLRARPG